MSKSAYSDHGSVVFSYATCIWQRLPDGLTIGNVTRYSNTTSHHQSKAGVKQCDVLLDNVPRDTTDLLAFAIERHEVYLWLGHYIPAAEYMLHFDRATDRLIEPARIIDSIAKYPPR